MEDHAELAGWMVGMTFCRKGWICKDWVDRGVYISKHRLSFFLSNNSFHAYLVLWSTMFRQGMTSVKHSWPSHICMHMLPTLAFSYPASSQASASGLLTLPHFRFLFSTSHYAMDADLSYSPDLISHGSCVEIGIGAVCVDICPAGIMLCQGV